MISLGPFVIDRVVGRGSAGQVWHGQHRDRGHEVAVKVLTPEAAGHPYLLAAFRNEARAAAGLDHPNIASVYDFGQIPVGAETASGGQLKAGSPYLVMEMAAGGSLEPWMGRLPWSATRVVLVRLLGALAHAHARGVLHRDLKPANTLLAGDWDHVKLTDFGLAWSLGVGAGADEEAGVVGTPAYMAPEQFEGSAADYGPWTDLYGLGCLAYALLTGAPPFGSQPFALQAKASHLLLPPPPLPAQPDVPWGLERWLHRLLDKEPGRRYQRAADALFALDELARPAPVAGASLIPRGPRHLPVPATWSTDQPQPGGSEAMRGVGLGLLGLRPLPFVGRRELRDELWSALVTANAEHSVQVRVLRGLSGHGKSRLGEWLCQRAHELGSASIVAVSHAASGGRSAGLGPALARAMGFQVQDVIRRDRLLSALRRIGVAPAALESEADGLIGALDADLTDPGDGGVPDRAGVLARTLVRMAADRPLILWLDDAHWGAESLAVVLRLIERAPEDQAPVLVLAALQEEELASRPDEQALIQQILGTSAARALVMGPLSGAEMGVLVRDVLGLEDELAIRVEARSAGNPLYAVQLVQTWALRGLLLEAPAGFRARAGARLDLPDDLHQVWAARLEQALRGRDPRDGVALELAAVLGLDIDGAEWAAAANSLGFAPPWELVDALLRGRLVRCEGEDPARGWSFANGLFRACLLRRAREAGRWRSLHQAAANALASEGADRNANQGKPERLGRHLLAAGDPVGAAGPLLEGARLRYLAGSFREASLLVLERERALREATIPEEDPRWAQGWLLMSRCALELGRLEEASLWSMRASQVAGDQRAIQAESMWLRAQVCIRRGDGHEAVILLDEARRWAGAAGDGHLLAECRLDQAGVLLNLGLLDRAAQRFRKADGEFAAISDGVGRGRCALGLGMVAAKAGRLEEASSWFVQARTWFDQAGSRWRSAEALTLMGEASRQRGHLDEAEASFVEATSIWRALSAGVEWRLRSNQALLRFARGQHAEARQQLEECLAHFENSGHSGLSAVLHACLCPCLAFERDWAAVETHLRRADDGLIETGAVDVDAARMLTLAGRLCASGGQTELARRCYSVALEHWRSLPRAAEARSVETALAHLHPAGEQPAGR